MALRVEVACERKEPGIAGLQVRDDAFHQFMIVVWLRLELDHTVDSPLRTTSPRVF
jgi:hypothetical protein